MGSSPACVTLRTISVTGVGGVAKEEQNIRWITPMELKMVSVNLRYKEAHCEYLTGSIMVTPQLVLGYNVKWINSKLLAKPMILSSGKPGLHDDRGQAAIYCKLGNISLWMICLELILLICLFNLWQRLWVDVASLQRLISKKNGNPSFRVYNVCGKLSQKKVKLKWRLKISRQLLRALKSGIDIHCFQSLNPTDFGDPLTFSYRASVRLKKKEFVQHFGLWPRNWKK